MENNLSVLLPVLNEQETIRALIDDIFDHLSKHTQDFEVIVIDDGSSDHTSSIIRHMQGSWAALKMVSHRENKGYGYALRTGISASTKDWVLIMDADGQFRIDAFGPFWSKKQDYDFILGYREKRNDHWYRLWLGKTGNFVSNLLLKKEIADINCGFKLFKKKDLDQLILSSTGGVINFEILYCLFMSNRGYRFLQCPVRHYPRKYGRQTGGKLKTINKILAEGTQLIFKTRRAYV